VEYSALSAASFIVHSSPASLVVGTADSHRGGLNPMRFHKFEDVLKPVPNAPAKLRIWNSLPLAAKISQGLDGDIGDPAYRLFPEVPNFFVFLFVHLNLPKSKRLSFKDSLQPLGI